MKLPGTIKLNLLLTIIVISALGYYSYLSYQRIERLKADADAVNHTNIVKLKLEQILSYMKDAGMEQRGFLLTKDSAILLQFYRTEEDINKRVVEVESSISDDYRQQENIKTLRALIYQRNNFLISFLKTKRKTSANASAAQSYFADKNKMDTIRAQVASMLQIEDTLLLAQEKAKEKTSSTTPFFAIILSFVSLLIISIAFYTILKGIKKQTKLSEELSYSKSLLQNMINAAPNGFACYEAIRNAEGKITDFKIKYINREITKIFGLVPEHIIEKPVGAIFPNYYNNGSFNHLKECVETGSHVEYENEILINNLPLFLHVQVEKLQDGITMIFRDITEEKKEAKEKLLKYDRTLEKANEQVIKTNAALITANRKLERSNKELERSNEELSSITYVASHDLQEPLRKIRMLLSLIQRKESDHFTGDTKEYFGRVTSSAERMRTLIDGLVNYSQANTSAIAREETDLNDLVKEVKYSLHHIIEEKHAVIKASPLPKIKVVRLQFVQLFSNILENAIKYGKHNTSPRVHISAQVVKGEEIYQPVNGVKSNYWKVSIADNGIGFEQQYENKIFDIFQRLHGKAEYNGTGMGLAICKKVVQNHNGFITANGEPGVGSTFNIFIPVV
jgi:signal transduction histidine kinase/CHASE3 domain sensor protein